MSTNRSRGIVGIFILVAVLFSIFLVFAFYTVMNLKQVADENLLDALSEKNAEIAVVEVEGAIMDAQATVKKLIKAEKDETIKAIILRVNSPGGAVGPTQEIYEEIRRIDADIKPIYASFGTVAASGGYYIGAAARKIYAPAGTLTGSIGVIMNFMNLSELYQWAKVSPEIIKAGKYKDIGSPSRSMTEEEKLLLRSMTSDVHEQFIQDIFKVRGKKIKDGINGLRQYAQGQIYSGAEAQRLGLVDETLGLWQAGREIHKEMGLKSKFALKFVKLKKDFSWVEFMNGVEETSSNIKQMVQAAGVPLFMYKP